MKSMASLTPVRHRRRIRRQPAGARFLALAILCTVALTAAGCRIMAPRLRTNASVHAEADIAANAEQMRLRMRAQVQPLCGIIAASADQIIAGDTNRAVRRQALLWKIEAVPALREALFQPSPVTALTDAWVMSFQMTEYFKSGEGREKLGDAYRIAVEAGQQLERELAQVAASFTVSGEVSKAREFAQKWAAQNPIRHSIASRKSTLNRAMEKDLAGSYSAAEAMGNLTISVDDLNRRIEIYSAQLVDQVRWQAELFTLDMAGEFQVEQALPLAQSVVRSAGRAVETMDRLVPPVERALVVLERAPGLIADERGLAIEALRAELTRTITFVQQERIAALKHLTSERIAAVLELHDAVVQERKALTRDLDQMSVNVVDHAFQRAAQLGAVVLVVVFLGIVALLFLVRRLFGARPTSARPSPAST